MAFWAAFFVALAFTVAGELLRPKQKPTDAKPASIDDFDLPTVSETRNWPWFVGTCKIDGPNLTWYGDLRTEEIKKKVKTGWFSSTRVTVNNKYFLGMEMFLGIGGDAGIDDILQVRFGDKMPDPSKYTKTVTADEIVFTFDDPDFFGGNEEGGGVSGTVRIAKGTQTQNSNSYVQTVLGRTRSAYRGLCYAVFEGFYWGTRENPTIPSFVVQRFPNTLGMTGGKHRIGDDANAACMIYELLTDMKWGGQLPSSRVDSANFIAIGNKLFDEGIGLSMLVNSARSARDQVSEILRHIDGVLYIDPETGLMKLALARDDYDVETLPVFDDDSITSFQFSRGSWSETKNTLMLQYVDRDADFTIRPLTIRDSANVFSRGGITEAEQLDMLGFSSAEPAAKRGYVALKTMSYPLMSGKLQLNSREARKLRPGSVIKVNWEPEGIVGLVLRIGRISYGDPMSNRVEMECIEDVFSLSGANYILPPPSNWTDPVTQPQPLVAQYALEAPYQLINEPSRYIITVGSRFSGIDSSYDTWQDETGGTNYVHTGSVHEFTPTGVLAADYPNNTPAIDPTGFVLAAPRGMGSVENATQDEFLAGDALALIVSAAGQEFVAWRTVVNNGNGTYTVSNIMRGVFDTVPLTHAAGARVWVISYGMGMLSETPYAVDGPVTGKLLPRNVRGVLPLASATALLVNVSSRALRPYPPGRFRVNDETWPTFITGEITASWAHRDRLDQEGVVDQDTGDIGPEGGTTYTMRAYLDDVLVDTQSGITGVSATVSPSGDGEVRIEVESVRDGLPSWQPQVRTFEYVAILQPLEISGTLPNAIPGVPYNGVLTVSGAVGSVTYSIPSGELPPGIAIDHGASTPTQIVFSGTPEEPE